MPVSDEQDRPAAKRCKVVVSASVGKKPKEFLNGEHNITKMVFHIHDFANRKEKKGEYLFTPTIKAHDHLWKLAVFPQSDYIKNTDVDRVVIIYLLYDGKNTELDPVVAKGYIRTKTIDCELPKCEYSEVHTSCGIAGFTKRTKIIENDCDDAGTLTITVELQVATEKRSVWFPQLTFCDNHDIGMQLYNSNETSDITFIIGASKKEFYGHKCILFLRARVWYELFLTELESSSKNNNNIIILADVDEKVFEVILRFVYTGEVPKLNKYVKDNDNDEEIIKSILITANRFGVTALKLYAESILIGTFLVPSNTVAYLLFADSYSCGYLQQESMKVYVTDSPTVIASNGDDWKLLQQSPKLLAELLVYATSDRKRYSSIVEDGVGTITDADELDVTSLRERLQKVNLDVDGSREILVERWKEYLLSISNNINNNNKTTTS